MKSYYYVLFIPANSPFPWKSIWKVMAPFESGILCVDGEIKENFEAG